MNIFLDGNASWRSWKDFLMNGGDTIGRNLKRSFGRSSTKKPLQSKNDKHMKIKVLGCSGAELPGHRPPSFLLDGKILFDTGSLTDTLDIKGQLRIKHIFISHPHLDHILGIPFLADNLIFRMKGHREK